MLWVILYIVMTGIAIGTYIPVLRDFEPAAVLCGILWPITIPALISYKVTLAFAARAKEKAEIKQEQKRIETIENNLREQEIRKALKELNNSL